MERRVPATVPSRREHITNCFYYYFLLARCLQYLPAGIDDATEFNETISEENHDFGAAGRRGSQSRDQQTHPVKPGTDSSAGLYATNPCFPRRKPGFFCTVILQLLAPVMTSAFLITTRLRPPCLASYMARSAMRTMPSAVSCNSRLRAIPIDAVMAPRDLPP